MTFEHTQRAWNLSNYMSHFAPKEPQHGLARPIVGHTLGSLCGFPLRERPHGGIFSMVCWWLPPPLPSYLIGCWGSEEKEIKVLWGFNHFYHKVALTCFLHLLESNNLILIY